MRLTIDRILPFVAVLWFALVAAGFAAWEVYDALPDTPPAAPAAPPAPAGRWSLTMYVHPHCPCTRATLDELAEVLADGPVGRADVRVVFFRPYEAADEWANSVNWAVAACLPDAVVVTDPGGREATAAGATTSGTVVLTDPAGRVAFRGGVTRGRGRAGDCPGSRSVAALLAGRPPERRDAPVYGCPLLSPGGCLQGDGLCPR